MFELPTEAQNPDETFFFLFLPHGNFLLTCLNYHLLIREQYQSASYMLYLLIIECVMDVAIGAIGAITIVYAKEFITNFYSAQ